MTGSRTSARRQRSRHRQSNDAAGLQAGLDADAGGAARLLQCQFAVAQRLPRLLQGPARPPGRRFLTVTVNITDQANCANESQRNRTSKEEASISDFVGSKPSRRRRRRCSRPHHHRRLHLASDGKGSVHRQEALQTNVAAVVTQVLPNGNLVVEGQQEIRVNFEIRELIVAGIVRPEDIQSDNTSLEQDRAGAHRLWRPRPITDVQQPRTATGVRRAVAVLSFPSPRGRGEGGPPKALAKADRVRGRSV